MAKSCKKGGIYEYFTDMRYKKNGTENYKLVEDILDGKKNPLREFVNTGDLMVFKGNKSLHRVTEILEGERILITFNFNTTSKISLSENSRRTFFGRLK